MGTQCPPIPEIVEKAIELALTSSITKEFHADGSLNDEVTTDLDKKLDLEGILADGGIDVSMLDALLLAGAQYRTIEPDPVEDRQIVGGTVTVDGSPLITEFNVMVNDAPDWTDAELDAAGVDVLNEVLDRMVRHVRDGDPLGDTELTLIVDGVSEPQDQESNFRWELKLLFTVVGTITVDSVEF